MVFSVRVWPKACFLLAACFAGSGHFRITLAPTAWFFGANSMIVKTNSTTPPSIFSKNRVSVGNSVFGVFFFFRGLLQKYPQYCWEFHGRLWEALSGTTSEKRSVPSRTGGGGERIPEMLWSLQVPWAIGFVGSQPYSRGEFQEKLWEHFRGLSGIFPEFFLESPSRARGMSHFLKCKTIKHPSTQACKPWWILVFGCVILALLASIVCACPRRKRSENAQYLRLCSMFVQFQCSDSKHTHTHTHTIAWTPWNTVWSEQVTSSIRRVPFHHRRSPKTIPNKFFNAWHLQKLLTQIYSIYLHNCGPLKLKLRMGEIFRYDALSFFLNWRHQKCLAPLWSWCAPHFNMIS